MAYLTFGVASLVMMLALRFLKYILHQTPKLQLDLPVVGLRPELFSKARAALRQVTNGVATLMQGYGEHSRLGRPFLMYESSFQQELLLPPEHVKWFAEQADSTLSHAEVRLERHAIRYLHAGVHYESTNLFVEKVVRDGLTKNLDIVQAPMLEEIRTSLDSVLTSGSQAWTTLNVHEAMQEAISPVMGRIFFGQQLCRDEDMLCSFRHYCTAMGLGIVVVGQLPSFLKRVFVPFFNVPLWYYRRKSLNALQPVVERQLQKISESHAKSGTEDPYDFFQQCAKTSARLFSAKRDTAADSRTLAEWIMLVCFTGLLSQIVQTSNLLLDIAHCSKTDPQLYEALRKEAASALQTEADWKNPASFKKLRLLDSTIRESLRCHPILVKGLTKQVVSHDGVRLPDGTPLPYGTWLGIPVLGVHMDERFYPNPHRFDPYRFIPSTPNTTVSTALDGQTEASVAHQLEAGRPSDIYFGFGHGRHSCPGRWLAVLMLKTMTAYIVLNYEMEPIGEAPKMETIGDASLPPKTGTIRIRRRLNQVL
ncbi:cytochrome P450 [Thozetella sp. PMI_491]|nr:cytochrome P450 [Thozetella sp. PMI_491]